SSTAGWHSRAQPHPDPSSFTPTRDTLSLAVLRNAPADPEGFTLALFSPDIAVDASGSVLRLENHNDFTSLVALANQANELPRTGSFMNMWCLKRARTSQPIERLFVPLTSGELVQTSVQGYEKGLTELKERVGEYTTLPGVLQELFGLVEEARAGYVRGEEDKAVIEKV
ncbi:hypothetical protein BC835DRAFT_1253549, partial [Cytidiella melzeri]